MSTKQTEVVSTVGDLRWYLNPIDGPGLSISEASERSGVSRQAYYQWREKLSETDQAREDAYPGFHQFDDQEYEKICVQCQYVDGKPRKGAKTFRTRLRENRFCSEQCRPLSRHG